ncbi:threonine-phosphate decarboxylase CobD [Pseudomonas matsuisoli]|uniref:threonine-phosphate decarboxylase n=1 Tax=Pseudomonas matsuisoli TaxID=1515666 RepID=A0A917PSX4_9PSED|nr:threonine-phosphate decarboxylase CobD [Pseudomonas matsuisoli]GGJ90362.1 threonine-phosphate decarboxylase [Pseudomonas matsuisoli]
MLEHGGRLRAAAKQFGIPLAEWMDLSTGIAPAGLPIPPIPTAVWNRLPEPDDELREAAAAYYGVPHALPVAGSQAAIQALPQIRRQARIGIVSPCYAEHAHAWKREGHSLLELTEAGVPRAIERLDVLLVINPNNPTGRLIPSERLLEWHARLAERNGWLIVDEAFMDCTPTASLAPFCPRPGLVVLRSFGKFFGMAGARLGFVLADGDLSHRLERLLGPWTVNGPTRHVAIHQLRDVAAQQRQRDSLHQAGARLASLLTEHGLPPTGGCPLFQWCVTRRAEKLHRFLAAQGILVRLFHQPASVRFGLPADEAAWTRLDRALHAFQESEA